jgi:dTDP-glucose 4,6-dehydratase
LLVRVLVTGARGFIGTHLFRELTVRGHMVITTDKGHADLAEPYAIEKVIADERPEYVVHLGARYGRLLCRDEPHISVCENTAGTTELAATCADLGIPVLYTSSSEVYGDHGTDTITEDSELRMPTTIYGLSKRWGEEALSLYLPPEKLLTVRMNMLYGPEQVGGYGRCSLATFIKNAVEGEPFTVHEGTTRSWLYISDAVSALRQLIEGGHTGVFNLGNPAPPYPMSTVAKMVGGHHEIVPAPDNQIAHKNYDCSKLLEAIDWRPEVGLADGIKRTIEWAREEVRVAA